MVNNDIIEAIKTIDRYKNLNDDIHYRSWWNKVVSLIKQSKKAQYSAIINENNNNQCSIWKLFKEIGINKQKSIASISKVKINGQETEDNNKIANAFNIFFCLSCIKFERTY